MKKVILAAGAVLILSLLILGCTSQERQQFKIPSPPTPTTTSTPRPEATPSPVPTNYGYEELPSEPTEEELEAIIKRVEEEQGIEITGVIEGLDVPKDTSTPEPIQPTPTPAPVQPTTKPETNGSYEPDKIPSDISGITPPAPDSGRDPTIDQESLESASVRAVASDPQ